MRRRRGMIGNLTIQQAMAALIASQADSAYTMTATTTSAGQTVTIQQLTHTTESFTIQWGDGDTSEISAGYTGTITHVYASAGVYSIVIPRLIFATLDMRDSKLNLGDAADLPRVTNTLRLENVSITGDASDLPRVTNFLYLSTISISGDAADLPRVTNTLYLINVSITGDAADLPRVTNTLYLQNVSITGDASDLPRVTFYLYLQNVSITGDASDLPRVTFYLYLQNVSITGDASDLPRVTFYLYLQNVSITGDASDLPRVTDFLYLINISITGDVADLPATSTEWRLLLSGTSTTLAGGAVAYATTRIDVLDLSNLGYTEAQVDGHIDRLHTDRASITLGSKNINLGGTNAPPSAAASALIPDLTAAGFTVTVSS